MSVDMRRFQLATLCGAAGIACALGIAPGASAEPAPPVPPPGPVTVAAAPDQAVVPPPDAAVAVSPDGQQLPVLPPDGVAHLASPEALPPGSTMDPLARGAERPNVNYLKDLWHAVQNQEISGKEALIFGLAQRGMNTPYPDQAPGPNVPTGPAPEPPLSPAPAAAAPLP